MSSTRTELAEPAPLVIAHRGASGHLPENTLPAFALAVEQGADMIETDLHLTRDGAVVLVHDERLEALGGSGEIADATLEEVRTLDAGGGERVPTLGELLDGFGGRIAFNLEFKRGGRGEYTGLEALVLEQVVARGLLESTLFSSFHDPVLHRLRALAPEARIGLLLSVRFPMGAIDRARGLGAEALHPERPLATPALLAEAREAGLATHVFTVDEEAEMRRLLGAGARGLFTNFPGRMRELLGRTA